MMIERRHPIDKIIHIDTTKEFPQMYRHIERVKEYIYPLKITTIKMKFDYYFKEHVRTRGNRKGEKGYGWPDFQARWCTAIKKQLAAQLISGMENVIEYHGIAADEARRSKRNKENRRVIGYPLIQWNISERQALECCYLKGFTWEGLYQKFNRVSCWCCPLSKLSELKTLHNEFPKLWEELRQMDKTSYRRFRYDYSVQELETRFSDNHL
jgi:3'-phosphoadenosine 5'-phosphosulfate sulfotransferase (PAPS reductase)/FAD synthetase